MHIKYPKIKRLGDEDNNGILLGDVIVQEKIDGANTSVWVENGNIKCGTRNKIIESGFNGFVEYVKSHKGIKSLLQTYPKYRLYGEWLVRHTIHYKETSYKQFYLFDILIIEDEIKLDETDSKEQQEISFMQQCKWLNTKNVFKIANDYNILTPYIFIEVHNPQKESLIEYVGKSNLGDKGEGIVIRNDKFINKWGHRALAKIVTPEFKENNAIVFGGNNKYSEFYTEMKMVNKYMTLMRVKKIIHKLQPLYEEKLNKKHTKHIINVAYHDMFEEELWNFVKKHPKINFKQLQRLACKKAARIYHDILANHESVAYLTKQ